MPLGTQSQNTGVLNSCGWSVRGVNAVIVENRVNLMTLPKCTRAIAIGGLGNGASLLRYVQWLQHARVWYWGDLDREGLEILSRVRAIYPATTSIFMDREALDRYRHLTGPGSGRRAAGRPAHLTTTEADAFDACDKQDLRLEQERIPQSAVEAKFAHDLELKKYVAAVPSSA